MAYGMGVLRKAGQRIGELDANYANAIDERFGYSKNNTMVGGFAGLTSAVPVRSIINNPYKTESPANDWERVAGIAMDSAVLGSNLAARYALPAGGVTLAGVGLYDLATQLNGADQQTAGTLSV